jgi:hypothetical protein
MKEMNDERPFLNDIKEKTADELVEMYSFMIRRAVNSKDETFVPELNGTIKNTTLRLLELGFEINNVYEKFIKENNERQKREIIEIYDKETSEKLSECIKINELLSSTKKKHRKSEYDNMNERVKLFAYGGQSANATTPARNTRSRSDPTQSHDNHNSEVLERSKSYNDSTIDTDLCERENKESMIIKEEVLNNRGPGRPPKKRGPRRPSLK